MYPVALLWISLLACPVPAERVGVEIPKGGADSLSQEDLKRDLWLLSPQQLGGPRRPGEAGYSSGLQRIEARLAEMKTLPGFGDEVRRSAGAGTSLCTQKDGRSGRAVVVAALDEGDGADQSAASIAALISLAKAFDVPETPKHTVLFCVLPEPGGLEAWLGAPAVPLQDTVALLTLGPLAGPSPVKVEELELGGARRVHVSSGPQAFHGTPDDTLVRVDYVELLERVRLVLQAVEDLQGL